MVGCSAPTSLQAVLEEQCEKIHKARYSVLFRRGEKAFGMFVVLDGMVSLDFGMDSPLARSYGPGAIVGLPATVTRRNYSMTATVTEDSELGFWSPEMLESLLHNHPEFCCQVLAILGERVIEGNEMQKALLTGDELPPKGQTAI
jgi:CRP-like cAMP-binding protein